MKITLSAQVKKQKQIKNKKHHYTLLTVTQVNAHRKPMLPVDVMETEQPASTEKQHPHHKIQSQTLPVDVVAAHQSWGGGSGCRMNIFILVFSILAMQTQLSNPLPGGKMVFLFKTDKVDTFRYIT